jgi:hypothetical protein
MLHDKPLQTFISYSRVNKQFAIRLASELKSAGFCIWLDMFDIPTGARWDEAVEKALSSSQIFLFIMTPDSVTSENAKDEVGYAIDHGKHILPVLLEPCQIPLRVHRLQYVDFTQMSFEEGIESAKRLLSSLVRDLEDPATEKPNRAGGTETLSGMFTVNEPKTVPTSRASTHLLAHRASRATEARISSQAVRRVGLAVLGALMIGAILMVRPLLNTLPSPSAEPSLATTSIPPTGTTAPSKTPAPTSVQMTQTPQLLRTFRQDFSDAAGWNADWTLHFRHGNPKKQENFIYVVDNGELKLNINYEYVWGYFLYNPAITYESVEVEAVVSNLRSTASFGLVCQAGEKGWYEFDITGEGFFYARYVDGLGSSRDEDRYLIGYGSVSGFKDSYASARENVIRVLCSGNSFSLWVNDRELMKDVASRFPSQHGQIGFTVRSFENYPVYVAVQSIEAREPDE